MTEKSEKLGVGLTKDEKRAIRVAAARRGKTMSELAREILLSEIDYDDEDEGNTKTAIAD